MGSESAPSPNLTDDNPQQTQDPEPVTERETSSPSVFVNSEPIREDQVQNAVKFLSHPKVKGSPVMYRRSFLEKKGLSKDEIDEAFRRVPDPTPSATTTPAINQNQDRQVKLATNMPQSSQSPQPAGAGPTGVVSTITAMRPAQFHWSHAFYAIGILAASGAGTAILFKKAIVPRLKSWIRKVVLEEENDSVKKLDPKPSLVEEAAAAAKSAAAAAADIARASQDILNSKLEERRYFESFRNLLDVQVEEMKTMNKAIRQLVVTKEVSVSSSYKQTEEPKSASASGWPLSPPASVEPTVAPHPKSYMEIMAMVQRGEKPPGIKEINDLPPNPNQPPSNPRVAPRIKPWEMTSQGQNGSTAYQTESSSNSMTQDYFPSTQPPPYRTISNNDRMNQRAWVPPQPPPIAMPEAAAAIRQPKTAIPIEQSNGGNQLTEHPSNEYDELQRITKIAESGGEVEISEVDTVPRVTEIQEEL